MDERGRLGSAREEVWSMRRESPGSIAEVRAMVPGGEKARIALINTIEE